MVIREKFSAREFWDDVVRYDCTMFQYIGELCRYLVNSPPHPNETRTGCGSACGNGLRPDVWEEFQKRFRIPRILEFYARDRRQRLALQFRGQAGRDRPRAVVLAHRFPVAVVRFDVDASSRCATRTASAMRCAPNEPGEAIGKIVNDPSKPGQPLRRLCRRQTRTSGKSCATCSRKATPGSAPAT